MLTKALGTIATRIIDAVDERVPDRLRVGDLYDVASGRTLLAKLGSHPGDHVTMRRARATDLTSSGLGFELLISFGGQISNALVHLPAREHPAWRTGGMRVVLDSHGFGDAPRRHSARSGVSETIVRRGSIALALGGSRGEHFVPLFTLVRSHDGMNARTGHRFKEADGARLVTWLMDELSKALKIYEAEHRLRRAAIDPTRTVAVGFSNGGALATTLAAEGVVEHAISFSGPTTLDLAERARGKPANMVFVEGLMDTLVPPSGATRFTQPGFLVAEHAARIFLETNGASGAKLSARNLPGFLAAFAQPGVAIKAKHCPSGKLVAVVRIDDNGHAVPGSAPFVHPTLDATIGFQSSQKLSGAELVGRFLDHIDATTRSPKTRVRSGRA